jgi:hypothetical protein
MEDGGWRMEDGGWRMEDGGWRMEGESMYLWRMSLSEVLFCSLDLTAVPYHTRYQVPVVRNDVKSEPGSRVRISAEIALLLPIFKLGLKTQDPRSYF